MRQDQWDERRRLAALDIGKKADVLILDIPNYKYLPYHFGVDHVEHVIKKGKIVYKRPNRWV